MTPGRSLSAPCSHALQHHRAGAVAEQHAGGAVAPVEQPRTCFGADHQHALVRGRRRNLSAVATAKMKPEQTA